MGFILLGCSSEKSHDPIQYADPFVGTGGSGHTFPGATLPFGMVQLSPNNGELGDKHYFFDHNSIIGFCHTHVSGTGTWTLAKYANILFMPTVGRVQIEPGSADDPDTGYRSRYSKEKEDAGPGYYKVELDDYDTVVELTATERAGVHRYQFPESEEGNIIIDITRFPTHGRQDSAFIEIIGDNSIAGSTTVIEREGNIPFTWNFYAEFSKPFESFATFSNRKAIKGRRSAKGNEGVGAYVNYKTKEKEQIVVQVGISFTGMEGARKNLRAEVQDWDFDQIKAQAEAKWYDRLGKVKIRGGTKINRSKFYTGLYHSMLFPRTFSDADGVYYSHFRDDVINEQDFTYYVDFSLWDTYRTLHPLFTILEPERQVDMIKTMLAMYEQGGRIPLQTTYRNFYSSAMIGDHASTMILDTYLKGIRDFDVNKSYEAMRKNAFVPGTEDKSSREGLSSSQKLGYIAADRVRESVSLTLEDASVDWALAQMAKDLGRNDDYEILMERSQYYRNLYDRETDFFRPRLDNGNWLPECETGEDPEIVSDGYNSYYDCWDRWWVGISPNRHYTESNAWQYLFTVPHDIEGLIELMGGKSSFENRLDNLFILPTSHSGPFYEAVRASIGQYVQGNQPSHHIAYLYNFTNSPWKTQDRVREIMESKYRPGPRGLPGPDDMGQMSSWFVFSALGFYPVTPGAPLYQIGSPLFEEAEINLGAYYDNRVFRVIARNNSGDNKFIQTARLNGEELSRPWITHEEIVSGGELVFDMGPLPNKKLWTQ